MKKAFAILALSGVCVVGCGQKGPLYLPNGQPAPGASKHLLITKQGSSASSSAVSSASSSAASAN